MDREVIDELRIYCKKLKLLYVEDNILAKEQTILMLKIFFIDIDSAQDGKEGIEKFSNNHYDLVISDIRMPNLDGLEMFEKMRELNDSIPLIIISAYKDTDFFLKSIDLTIDGYLFKPLNIEKFVMQIKKTILKIKMYEENKRYKEEIEKLNQDLEKKVELKTKQIEMKLYIDDLTRIKSRYALEKDLSATQNKQNAILFSIDIDSFSFYNDLYGLDVGNHILESFATSLKNYIKDKEYSFYRTYADVFSLYNPSFNLGEQEIRSEVIKLIKYIKEQEVYIEKIDDNISLDVTIGVSYGRQKPLIDADYALSCAKKYSQKYYIYDSNLNRKEELEHTLYWRKELEKAIDEDRIEPYFQPIYDRNLNIVKYESLVRIKQFLSTDEEKVISPVEFLEIAKKTKIYNKLSYTMISKALEYATKKGFSASVNIAMQDIENKEFVEMLIEKIKIFKDTVANKTIIIEILEDENISDYNMVKNLLQKLIKMGVKIAIDDFGSGYSNLKHILELSPSFIKIDGSLIKDIIVDTKTQELVKAMVQFAKVAKIKIIAEYVCSKEIYDTVHRLGIDEFQGFYLSKPLSIDSIEN